MLARLQGASTSTHPAGVAGRPAQVFEREAYREAQEELFRAGANRIGSEIQLTEPAATDSVDALLVGIDRQGRSVIVRSSLGGIFLRRFSSQGALLGPEALVVKTWTQVALAMQPDGSFTLVWVGFDVLARRFDANGNPAGNVFQVDRRRLTNVQLPAAAATSDGGFVAAWTHCVAGSSPTNVICEIRARRFDANSHPTSGELVISPKDGRSHLFPVAAAGARGFFAIGWDSCRTWASDCRAQVQLFSPAGAPARDAPTLDLGDELLSALSASPAGFVGVLQSYACRPEFPDCVNSSPVGVYGWRFDFLHGAATPGSLTAPAAGSDTD